MNHYSVRNLPPANDPAWGIYRKKIPTRMYRVNGPFTVDTKEGTLSCKDGYLAVDAAGYPYPVSKSDHDMMYEEGKSMKRPAKNSFAFLLLFFLGITLCGTGLVIVSTPHGTISQPLGYIPIGLGIAALLVARRRF